MHRDLKPDNIMFTSDNQVKILDFGLAKNLLGDDLEKPELHTPAGTPVYVAPNVLNRDSYSVKCDVWSAGAIFY